jgi:hypothetical protein
MWRRPPPGRERAPRARLTPERPGLGDGPFKLLRFPMAVSCCGVLEGASPRWGEPGTIAEYVRCCDLSIIAPSRGSNLDTARLIEEIQDAPARAGENHPGTMPTAMTAPPCPFAAFSL